MMIEVRETGFVNKGAELMLYAILEKINQRYPEAKFCMPTDLGAAPYEKRARLGLFQKAEFLRYGIQWGSLFSLLPKQIRKMYGIILEKEVDVVIDAAGFAYSQQWGDYKTHRLATLIRRWKKNNSKVILLPQAFGPFESTQIKKDINIVANEADLIFAREQISYDYLVNTVGERSNINLAPDFTNLIKGIVPEDFDTEENRFCIVPNYRMIDKTSKVQSEAYLPFMISCAKYLQEKEQKPFILIHEGADDLILAQKISDAVGGINIIVETHPLKIKGILGACEGTIGSRFHGLVSALSQGVPSLATGWSHKYKMLFSDYDFEDGLMDVTMSEDEIKTKIDLIIVPDSKESIKQIIVQKSEELKEKSQKMCDSVFNILNNK
jgi:polysaccharide pyruvyl transferase WcaK-like protein